MLKLIEAKRVRQGDVIILQLHPERSSLRDRVLSVTLHAAGTVVKIEVPGAVYERGLGAQVILVRRPKAKRRPQKISPPAYQLDVEEIKSAHAWIQKHGATCDQLAKGSIRYDLSNTGVGTRVEIACPCGEKGDITDYGSW